MNGPYAFLSYAREDEVVVTGLRRILDLNGISAWQDRSELHVGDKLEESIRNAVRASTWLIPIVSRHTARSSWVLKEFVTATSGDSVHPGPNGSSSAANGTPSLAPLAATEDNAPKRRVYPVVVTEEGDPDPRAVLRMSWFSDQLEPYINSYLPRRKPSSSDFRNLVTAIKQHWPEVTPSAWVDSDTSPEINSRRLLWSTFPGRFSQLESRFRELVWDAKTRVWVVVGLPNSGKSALLAWLQARCPFATRIDVGSNKNGELEERLNEVIVEVRMFDNIWGQAAMLRTLAAIEQHKSNSQLQLQLITTTPDLLSMVTDRLQRMGASFAVDYEHGVGYEETKRLVAAYAKDSAFCDQLRQLYEGTEARLRELHTANCIPEPLADGFACAMPTPVPVTKEDWRDSEKVNAFLWSHVSAAWIPFNKAARGLAPDRPSIPPVACEEPTSRRLPPPDSPHLFNSSLYDAVHRLQHFREQDDFHTSGLPKLPTWKVDYIKRSFAEGLSQAQQEAVRNVVRFDGTWCMRAEQRDTLTLLERCGVLKQRGPSYGLSDRIFAQYFVPPLVIHHLSDFHTPSQEQPSLSATLEAYRDEILCDEAKCPHLLVISGDLFGELASVSENSAIPARHPLRCWLECAQKLLSRKLHPFIPLLAAPRILVVGGNEDVDPISTTDSNVRTYWSAWRRRRTLRSLLDGVATHPYGDPNASLPAEPELAQVVNVGPLSITLIDSCAFGADDSYKQSTAWWLDGMYGLLLQSRGASDLEPSSELRGEGAFMQLPGELDAQSELGPGATFLAELKALSRDARPSLQQSVLEKLCRAITDFEPGYVSAPTLRKLKSPSSWPQQSIAGSVRLAVMHHPLGSAPNDSVGKPSELKNAGHVREALTSAHVSLVLHGHLHMHWADEFRNPFRSDWLLRTLAAPAFGGRHDNDALGFNEVRVRWEGSDPRILQRTVTRQAGAWIPSRAYEFSPGTHEHAAVVDV